MKDLLCSIVFSHLRRGHGNPLQYSCLENPHGQSLAATVHGVTESDTTEWLNIAKHIDGLNLDQEFGEMLPKKKMGLPIDWYQAKRHTAKPQIKRRKDLLLAASKKNTGDFSQSHISPTAKLRKF